jgi:ABC-type nitrate/sulfonate/bicarbonate transport system permease component
MSTDPTQPLGTSEPAVSSPRTFSGLRSEIPLWQAAILGAVCLALCFGVWWWLTRGAEADQRILTGTVLPSPVETFAKFPELWFDLALTRNTLVSLRRVLLGFGLATVVGVPVGVLCGCFRRVNAFFTPLTVVGRNIPVAALIPLTFSLFGIGEFQKVLFLFIACVAFVIMDTATAIADVSSRYIDTAYTLGARRGQVIMKVLVPLAMPAIFNSLRLLFGLAFGYIMLAELVKLGSESGGLGDIILTSQRRNRPEYILLVLMLIPLVALAIDRVLFLIQRQLFPYQYGGDGLLHHGLRAALRMWEDFTGLFRRSQPLPDAGVRAGTTRPPGSAS